jgi:hypothetical protein
MHNLRRLNANHRCIGLGIMRARALSHAPAWSARRATVAAVRLVFAPAIMGDFTACGQ